MVKYEYLTLDEERSLYGIKNSFVFNCVFDGLKDGESTLKEARNVTVSECKFYLRYPLWHDQVITIMNSEFFETSRAPLWYCKDINIAFTKINSVKTLRECKNIKISDCEIKSEEFAWRCKEIDVFHSDIEGFYAFFESKNIKLNEVNFKGKYSFQYVENLEINKCNLDTKDAFWHANNVTVKDSIVKGEYLGWYSNNLTFINCKIIGAQPLCYCKNLRLINCEMIDCDFAFEYSDVYADIKNEVISIKNPKSGKISCQNVGEIILENAVFSCKCDIEIRDKK